MRRPRSPIKSIRRPRRRGGLPPIALVAAAALGFAGVFGALAPDRPATDPVAFVDQTHEAARTARAPAASCNIKGNISIETGERIYHVPGQQYYNATKIRPEYGERYFCSEDEARAAGWRRSKV